MIAFIRIPKSGSTSLVRAVEAAFPPELRLFFPNTVDPDAPRSALQSWRMIIKRRKALKQAYGVGTLKEALAIIRSRRGPEHVLIGGHFDLRSARAMLGDDIKAVTILRSPISRAYSEYAYERRNYPAQDLLRGVRSRTLPRIAYKYSFEGYVAFLHERRPIYADIASRFLGWDGSGCASRFLESTLLHVGVLEAPADFAAGLSEKLRRPIRFPHENVTPGRVTKPCSRRTLTRIEELYSQDLRLHAAATEIVRAGRDAREWSVGFETAETPRPVHAGVLQRRVLGHQLTPDL